MVSAHPKHHLQNISLIAECLEQIHILLICCFVNPINQSAWSHSHIIAFALRCSAFPLNACVNGFDIVCVDDMHHHSSRMAEGCLRWSHYDRLEFDKVCMSCEEPE